MQSQYRGRVRGRPWAACVIERLGARKSFGGRQTRRRHLTATGDDEPARAVHREQPVARTAGRVKLSNLDKVFWPEEQITKGYLLDYYAAVAPVLLAPLPARPFTITPTPAGACPAAFFTRTAPPPRPQAPPARAPPGRGDGDAVAGCGRDPRRHRLRERARHGDSRG